MIWPYLKSDLFWHYFEIFGYSAFEKVIQNETFLFQHTELRACFLCEILCNKIPRVWFYFSSTVQNSEHFTLPRNCSERIFESYLFRGTAGIPPEQTNCSVYSVFHGIIFFIGNEIPTNYETFQRINQQITILFENTFSNMWVLYIREIYVVCTQKVLPGRWRRAAFQILDGWMDWNKYLLFISWPKYKYP